MVGSRSYWGNIACHKVGTSDKSAGFLVYTPHDSHSKSIDKVTI
jgi:hypothetical protein